MYKFSSLYPTKWLIGIWLLLFPTFIYAAESIVQNAEPLSIGRLLNLVGGLLLVLFAFFCFAWLVKRFSGTSGTNHGHIKVVDVLSVGTREKLVLINVADTYLLLGMTPGRINALHTLSEKPNLPETRTDQGFKAQMSKLLQQSPGVS